MNTEGLRRLVRHTGRAAGCMLVGLMAVASSMPSNAASDDAVMRAQIRSERQQVQAEFIRQEAICKQRFVVTSCMDDALATRRTALDHLREQEAVLDERERKLKAGQASQRVEAKRDALQRQEAKQAGSAASAASAGAVSRPAPAPRAAKPAAAPKRSPDSQSASRRAAYDARLLEAERHRAEVEARNAARAAKGKKPPAKPLPGPDAP